MISQLTLTAVYLSDNDGEQLVKTVAANNSNTIVVIQ
jgi:hypothetical protein